MRETFGRVKFSGREQDSLGLAARVINSGYAGIYAMQFMQEVTPPESEIPQNRIGAYLSGEPDATFSGRSDRQKVALALRLGEVAAPHMIIEIERAQDQLAFTLRELEETLSQLAPLML